VYKLASIPEALYRAQQEFADIEAIADVQDGGRRLSYAELTAEAESAAAALIKLGVEPGDRVALWAQNMWEWPVIALGIALSGAILVPVNTRFKGLETAYALERSGAKLLFTVDQFLGVDYPQMLRETGRHFPDLKGIVTLRGRTGADVTSYDDINRLGDAELLTEVRRRAAAVQPDDVSAIIFTSGTTGDPKGVMLAGGALLRSFTIWSDNSDVKRGDRVLATSPYFHLFGLGGSILACIQRGATSVPLAVWEPIQALKMIEAERITTLPGAPAVLQSLLNCAELDDYDHSSLRSGVTGAASIPEELIVQMASRLGFSIIATGYGMTESSGCCTQTRPGDDARTVALTSGCPVPGVEVLIVDDAGNPVPAGTHGEVLIRGFNVMRGYYLDESATRAAIDEEGWLHSGDIGYLDDHGYLDITGRKTDMIIVGGFNAYPAEIENLMLTNERVGGVSVVGVVDDRLGEVPAAFVVLAPGHEEYSAEELVVWCRQRVANYKVPRHVWFVDALPLNAAGKVLKRDLRVRAAGLLSPAVSTVGSE
jgi:HIP---CoA ligase